MKDTSSCYLDFSHSKPIGRIDPHEPYIALIWHDPHIMVPWEPPYNVAALSKWQAGRFREMYKQDCRVLDPICGDGDYFVPGVQKEDYLLFIGIKSPDKGALAAIEVCRKLKQKLKLIGPVTPGCPLDYVEAIRKACDGVDIEDLGEVPNSQKKLLIQGAKALLYPVSYPEGQGEAHLHKCVEAFLSGCPTVVFNQGAMKEIIEEGVTGFVVDGQDGIADAIKACELLDRTKLRERALQRWDYRSVVQTWLPIIDQVRKGGKW